MNAILYPVHMYILLFIFPHFVVLDISEIVETSRVVVYFSKYKEKNRFLSQIWRLI